MTDEQTIGELEPIVTLLPAALIEIEQANESFSATLQQLITLAGNPLTTKGDLMSFSTLAVRLPVGTDGQRLEADSSKTTGLNWVTPGATGIASINADTTAAQIIAAGTGLSISDVGATHTLSLNAALADLSDVTAKTGTGTTVVMNTSPTIVTPTIASFVNSVHSHLNAIGGGTITEAAISDLQAYWLDATTNTGTNKTLNSFTNNISADELHVEIRNESGGTINKGDLVFVSGYSVGQDLPLVSLADSSSISTMPSFGIVESTSIANNANGDVLIAGRIAGVDTSAFTAGDVLYVSNAGTTGNTITATKPTGTDLIEIIGEVLRSHATLGVIEIDLTHVEDLPNVAVHDLSMGGLNLTNVVIVTPTIASFVNSTHSHLNAAGGGTLTATAISDFDTEVSNNSSVVANTAKVTNATHTGDVTGATALTIANAAVDIIMLSATGTPSSSNFLRGDNTWATPGGSGDMVLADIQVVTGLKTFNDTKFALRNVADTFNGSFVNTNTADRIYTLPDIAGTVMLNLVEDTSPQLGGDLDANGFNIALDAGDRLLFEGSAGDSYIGYDVGLTGILIVAEGVDQIEFDSATMTFLNSLNINGENLQNVEFVASSGTEATSGFIRMVNDTGLKWRNAGGSGNFEFKLNASDQFVADAPFISPTFITPALGTPASGTIDLANVTITGSVAEFNTALQSETFAYIGVANAWGTLNQNIAATGKWQEAGIPISPIGTQQFTVRADAMVPGLTTGSNAPTVEEFGAENITVPIIVFPDGSDTTAWYEWDPPENWDGGTIKIRYKWTRRDDEVTPESRTVNFIFAAFAYGNNDPIGGALIETPQNVTDTTDSTAAENKLYESAQTAAITIAGTPADSDSIFIKITRDDSAGTMTGDALLLSINIEYTIDAGTSSG